MNRKYESWRMAFSCCDSSSGHSVRFVVETEVYTGGRLNHSMPRRTHEGCVHIEIYGLDGI